MLGYSCLFFAFILFGATLLFFVLTEGDCADLAPAVFRLAWLILLIWMAMLFLLLLLLLFVCCDCCCTGRLRFVVVLQDPSEQQQQQQRAPDPPPNSYQQSHSKYYCGASPDDLDRLRRDGDAFDRVASWSAQPGAQAPPAGVTSSSSSYRAASCTNVSVAQPLCQQSSGAPSELYMQRSSCVSVEGSNLRV